MWNPQSLYSDFLLRQPTILCGANSIRGLFTYPSSKVAVIYGSGFKESDKELFSKSVKSFDLKYLKKSWSGEPTLEELGGTIDELERFKPDVIIAVGGGAVIDGCKMARLYYEFPFFDSAMTRFNYLEWKTSFIAIPTTVGSGAEASSAAVILNKELKRKEMIVNNALMPSVVVLSPDYIKRSPEQLVVSSALDAISHIVEGYVSVINNDLADLLAEKGLQILVEELRKAEYAQVNFLRLQYAGYLAGIVQNHCIVGIAHAVAHQLAYYGYSHSMGVALMLPQAIKENSKDKFVQIRYQKLIQESGMKDIEELLSFIWVLRERAGITQSIYERSKVLLNSLLSDCMFIDNVINDRGGKGNPVPITKGMVEKLIENY
ncbi:iron-containing alcohol dehydrogenase [uncultured Parabacteroides sp.]|uniref:iron-containing alcohol dehydrogenase n=1 Tax=uncultured Parabacteroides sp. TaxID=512312 RepID=UPI0025E96F35|nr:iron-containing alcohol dehydrogenase [uncultured Parabacteroides sp.]